MTEKARGILLLSLVLAALRTSWAEENTGSPEPTPQATLEVSSLQNGENPEHGVDKRATYILQDDKRAQMGFHGMRGKKDFEPSEDWSLQDWSKRASMGFHGMRGKKWDDDDDISKRANMGFHGKRGKKWDDYVDAYKRAMGFHGMRGKKDSMIDDKRAMGFHGMRGKKFYEDEPFGYIPILDDDQSIIHNDEEKRAMAGFHGMRGKKDNEFLDFGQDKRASMGFHGMRGKKDDEEFLDDDFEKRAMGFHGMRGKKLTDFNLKRAMGFLGMRGKKDYDDWYKRSPEMGFYGMRGNKSSDDGDDINSMLSYLSETSPTVARRRRAVSRNSKKARTAAFVGMRGKKSVIISGLEELAK